MADKVYINREGEIIGFNTSDYCLNCGQQVRIIDGNWPESWREHYWNNHEAVYALAIFFARDAKLYKSSMRGKYYREVVA